MRNITVRKYKAEDMIPIIGEENYRIAQTRLQYGPAYTFFHGDKVLACAGVTIYWEGMGEVWLCTSKYWEDYKKEAVIWTRWVLDFLQDENKLRRIQADVVADNAEANRYIRHFGFHLEALMRNYDVLGRDCIRYSRIREYEE